MLLSGAYHWHNGVYNQIHSSPSVHRDMNADVVLYSHRLKEAGYRMGYVGKWHASWVRCPADFGYEMSAVQGCDPAILRKYDLNPDRIDTPRERLKATPLRMIQWPGANPVAEWGYHEGPVEATPEWHVAESAIRMLRRFAGGSRPWLLETHFAARSILSAKAVLRSLRSAFDSGAEELPRHVRRQARAPPPRIFDLGECH
jgi:hypothetical protein